MGVSVSVRSLRVLVAVLLVCALVPVTAGARPASTAASADAARTAAPLGLAKSTADYKAGEVLVRFKSGVTIASQSAAHSAVGATVAKSFRIVPNLYKVNLAKGSVEDAVRAYEAMPYVEYAQPNYAKHAAGVPNDPSFEDLWGMNNTGQTGGTEDADIDAVEAWDMTSGSDDVLIAVIDTGIDYNHPDLEQNMWINVPEAEGDPGVDDDDNGYTDDIHGWDSVNEDGDPMDDHGHGTHCSGTIGAQGDDGYGLAGVNWDVSIMGIKFLDAGGNGWTDDELECFEYADTMGVTLLSNSWGGYYPEDPAEVDAMEAMSDTLFFFAAGNNANDNDGAFQHYPSSYDLDNILAVGASDHNDDPAGFSNYGATSVDVFAPGAGIKSTVPGQPSLEADTLLYEDDFTDLSDWIVYNWGTIDWLISAARFSSGPSSLAALNYGDYEDAYLDPAAGQSVDISGYDAALLRYDYWLDTEPGMDRVIVWTDDMSNVWPVTDVIDGDSGGWVEGHEVPVPSELWGTTDLLVSYGFRSDESNNSADGYEGAYIDDVEVWGANFGDIDWDAAYDTWDGTSMATPAVAGLGALIRSWSPNLDAVELKTLIMDTVDVKASLSGMCVTGGRINALAAIEAAPHDDEPPTVTTDAEAAYDGTAEIEITAEDNENLASISYVFDEGAQVDEAVSGTSGSATVSTSDPGMHTLEYWATDAQGNQSDAETVTFEVMTPLEDGVFRVAGTDRYLTAIESSKRAFPDGAGYVVIATGANWPDALGGSALAGAAAAPLLLTQPTALPAAVTAEIDRLGATDCFILGGTGAVSAAVETQLTGLLGAGHVERLAGTDRYGTARAIADKVISLESAFDGSAIVATGGNYPDALGGSPVAASKVMPILLANPANGAVYVPDSVTDVAILGGTGAVSAATEATLKADLGDANVQRYGGMNRYETAALVASDLGVDQGLRWDGVGIATGENFPDALAAGAMLGAFDSVMLLTTSATLHPAASDALTDNADSINTAYIIGGTGAVSTAVENAVRNIVE